MTRPAPRRRPEGADRLEIAACTRGLKQETGSRIVPHREPVIGRNRRMPHRSCSKATERLGTP